MHERERAHTVLVQYRDACQSVSSRHVLLTLAADRLSVDGVLQVAPQSTPYANYVIRFTVLLPRSYPEDAALVKVHTRVFHPQIGFDGTVNVAARLGPQAKILASVVLYLLKLFHQMDDALMLDAPMNPEAAALFRDNREQFDERVRRTYAEAATTEVSLIGSRTQALPRDLLENVEKFLNIGLAGFTNDTEAVRRVKSYAAEEAAKRMPRSTAGAGAGGSAAAARAGGAADHQRRP